MVEAIRVVPERRWTTYEDGYECSVLFTSAFHRCHPDPGQNYGIGGIGIWFALRRDGRGIEWELLSGLGLPDEAFRAAAPDCTHPKHVDGWPYGLGPTAGPVTWHSPSVMYDFDLEPRSEECYITGGRCWSDTGFTVGDDAYRVLAVEGEDALWRFLRKLLEENA